VRVEQASGRICAGQVPVEQPGCRDFAVRGVVDGGGHLGGVRLEQVVEAEPARSLLFDQAGACEALEELLCLARFETGQRRGGGRGDVADGGGAEEPEQALGGGRQRVVRVL
jgi:hypothetical protein